MQDGWLPREEWLKTLDARIASAAVLLETEDGNVLALRASYKQHWSLPGGIVDAGESPLTAALREVREEIGLVLTPERLSFRAIACRRSVDIMSHQYIFHCSVAAEELENLTLQASEIVGSALLSPEEVLAGESNMAWSLKMWAEGRSGYFETQSSDVNNGDGEKITYQVTGGI